MKIVLITILLLVVSSFNIEASENNGVQEVKTGISAVFTRDNDGDSVNDFDDLCKNTAVTPTHTDADADGCDDSTAAVFEQANASHAASVASESESVDENKKDEDADDDGINDVDDGCVLYAPTTDSDENGCEDNTIRTMYISDSADSDSFSITGIAFVDGQEFSDPATYTTEVEFHNLTTGEYIPGKVATNYCEESINDELIGVTTDVSCSAFSVTFETSDFVGEEDVENNGNKETRYSVDITLTSESGEKYTETLYSFEDFQGNNSQVVRIATEDHRVHLTIN